MCAGREGRATLVGSGTDATPPPSSIAVSLEEAGETVSEKTVAKIMQENELVARPKRRFKITTDRRHTKRIADHLLQRDFTADAPNKVWGSDATAVWTLVGCGCTSRPSPTSARAAWSAGRPARHRRLPRRLLQQRAHALDYRLRQPHRV